MLSSLPFPSLGLEGWFVGLVFSRVAFGGQCLPRGQGGWSWPVLSSVPSIVIILPTSPVLCRRSNAGSRGDKGKKQQKHKPKHAGTIWKDKKEKKVVTDRKRRRDSSSSDGTESSDSTSSTPSVVIERTKPAPKKPAAANRTVPATTSSSSTPQTKAHEFEVVDSDDEKLLEAIFHRVQAQEKWTPKERLENQARAIARRKARGLSDDAILAEQAAVNALATTAVKAAADLPEKAVE